MNDLPDIIKDLDDRIKTLEKGVFIKKITIPTDGFFVIQKLTADPAGANLIEGLIWENTTTHHLKIYLNGSVTTII
jgi:hypothetical protein